MKQLVQEQRHVLGSEAVITLVLEDLPQAPLLFQALWQEINQFEHRFSRFQTTSELSQLNQTADQPFSASSELLALLQTALDYWHTTGGLYNPAVLPVLEQVGYQHSFETLTDSEASNQPLPSPAPIPSLSNLSIEHQHITLPPSLRLDFGGIGKGYLLDQLARRLQPSLPSYWIALGGDIYLSGQDSKNQPWRTSIQNPYQPDQDIAYLEHHSPTPSALATSAIFKRKGIHQGKAWHHLIDPRTGAPADTDLISATVIGPSATTADVLASCCIIAGSGHLSDLLRSFPDYSALCFPRDPHLPPLHFGPTQPIFF